MTSTGDERPPEPPARKLWRSLEPIHAVSYFSPESSAALDGAGLKGFWMGYFAARAAPLGAVGAAVVEATFYNFAPHRVRRAIPDAWTLTTPQRCIAARQDAAAATLRRLSPTIDADAPGLVALLEPAARAADCVGRPLAAANQAVELPDDPVARLWQLTTVLREHRGDGHVAALVANDLDGLECHVMAARARAMPDGMLTKVRGWSDDDWDAAIGRLVERGLVATSDDGSALTDDGRSLRRSIEATTDRLAFQPYADGLTESGMDLLLTLAPRVGAPIYESGIIPFPNPIGLTR